MLSARPPSPRRIAYTAQDSRVSETRLLAETSRSLLKMTSGFQCAGCGEWNETTVDSSAGRTQQYVEDCQVCCKPNVLSISWDTELEEFLISAELE